MSSQKKYSIIVIASKDEKDFSLLSKLKNKFSGHEIILSIDADNQISIETLNEINLNINKLVKVPDSTRGKSLNAGALKAENDYLWFLHIDSQIDKIEKEDLNRLQKNNSVILNYLLIIKILLMLKEQILDQKISNFRLVINHF